MTALLRRKRRKMFSKEIRSQLEGNSKKKETTVILQGTERWANDSTFEKKKKENVQQRDYVSR
jgi:hypothetical protein